MKKDAPKLTSSFLGEVQKKFTSLYDNYHIMDHFFEVAGIVAVSENPDAIDEYINERIKNRIIPLQENDREKFINYNKDIVNSVILFFNDLAADTEGKKAMKSNEEIAKALFKLSGKDLNEAKEATIKNGTYLLDIVLTKNKISKSKDKDTLARAIHKRLGDTFVQIFMTADAMIEKVQDDDSEKKDVIDLLNVLLTLCLFLNTLKMQKIITQFQMQRKKMLPGRNDPCHCGSGKKYKKCCMEKDQV